MKDIPELVISTLSELGRAEHVSTARVCHLWSEISLDLLWRNMRSLSPLFRVLAPMNYDPAEQYWAFSEEANQADWRWDRWAFYAPRIRQIKIAPGIRPTLDRPVAPESIRFLISSIPDNQRFPQLTSISCFAISRGAREILIPQCLPLISPALSNLRIAVVVRNETSGALDELIHCLTQSPASLQTLSIVHMAPRPYPPIAQCIARHSSTLSNLTLKAVFEENTWRSVCGIPRFNTLEFDFYPPLLFHNYSTPDIVDVLKTLAGVGREIRNLTVSLPGHPLFSVAVRSEAFAWLGRIQGVKVLVLTSSFLPKLEPQEIEQLGRSLGQLECLEIKTRSPIVPEEQTVTPASLLLFLRYFPLLKTLNVYLNFKATLPQVQTRPASSLEQLHVSASHPPLPAQRDDMDRFLESALPSQARIIHSFNVDSAYY